MRTSKRIIAVSVAAVALVLVAACDSSGGSGTSASPTGTLRLSVGVVESLTGDLSAFGPSYAQVAKMAVSDLQAAVKTDGLSSRYSARVVGVEDDQTEAAAGVEAATKLIAEGSNMILGSLSPTVTIAIANAATIPDGILQVAPGATSTALTDLKDNGLVFRTVPSDALTARALVSDQNWRGKSAATRP
jgi:branched-chain amino acid transport system substrate-binding protein